MSEQVVAPYGKLSEYKIENLVSVWLGRHHLFTPFDMKYMIVAYLIPHVYLITCKQMGEMYIPDQKSGYQLRTSLEIHCCCH